MPKYGYVVVEGPHDVELVYRLLSPSGFQRVQFKDHLDRFLAPLIPIEYPPGGDLQKRMPVPLFLQSATHAIAVHSAIGDTRLVETVEENSARVSIENMTGVGIILDSDTQVTPADRYIKLRDQLRGKGFEFPDEPGRVTAGEPRYGAFVLPDNRTQGTLEHLLLDCAGHVYPALLELARTHVTAAAGDGSLTKEDREELDKPAGRHKAMVGSIASILRPGRAIQVSIQDNRWLRGEALQLPGVRAVQEFLIELLGI